jgi:hypothetical protein
MSNYIVFHKPFTPLIDRFKALLKDRDAEMRLVLAKADVPPPRPKEILRIYGLVLSELTFNSVSLINQLTTIAGQHDREQAEAVAGAICARIIESNNGFIDDLANETKQFPNHPVLQETWNPISQPQSLQHRYISNESQPNYQMPVAPMLSSQNAEAQFRPSISSSTTNSNHNSFIHQERNFDHINTNQSQNNPFFPSHSQFIHPYSAPPYISGPPPNFGHNPRFTYVNTVMPNHVMSNQNSNPNPVYPNPPVGGGVVSNLISSLVAQGLISLGQPVSTQDSLEFNQDLQKVRHESAVTALYADLPRQCTTCGLRFKSREEHSNHMDWHVIKNRFSKKANHKNSSRQWYVSVSTWLSGSESSANPQFLQPTDESVTDTKDDDEELAVPADEDQTTCALCGESFDDFYSNVADEWMYRDAVYMYAPPGKVVADLANKSRLGPIVHAKCRPESRKRVRSFSLT